MPQVNAQDLVNALNLANDFRKAFGQEVLPDIPESTPADPSRCILAKLFNFDCEINGWSAKSAQDYATGPFEHEYLDKWYARFSLENEDKARFLAEQLGAECLTYEELVNEKGVRFGPFERVLDTVYVILPESIADIALAFDAGELDDLLEKEENE